MIIFTKDTIGYLETSIINIDGQFKSGLTVTYEIRSCVDDSLVASGTLSEVGTSGVYKTSYTFTNAGQYRFLVTPPIGYESGMEDIIVEEMITKIDEQIKRILGLCQENYRIIDPQYNKMGALLSGTIKIYASKSDCDGDISPIATYTIESTYGNWDQMTGYKVTKTS
jgi:hypothetical protein